MRVSRKLISLWLALIILAVSVVPVYAADTVHVQIQNKTGENVRISLSGPASYSFQLTSGKNKVEVQPGKYNYSYKACGGTQTGKFNAQNGATLTLPKCSSGSKAGGGEVKVTIKNNTGGTVTIYLSGPQSYVFSFGPGTSKMYITAGTYSYTVYGCGTSMSGTKKFKGGGLVWMFWCG